MFRTVMVPLDGSTFAEAALPLARAVVDRIDGATLRLVTVHEPVPTFAQADWEASAREWSEHYLSEVTRRLGDSSRSTIESAVLSGSVAVELEKAAEEGVDLLVMATHGRGMLSRAWLGSVADHFVRHSPCPVLLARPRTSEDEAPAPAEVPDIEHILVALDGSDFGETVLPQAERLAELFGASITLVQVIAYPLEIASPYLPHTVQMNQQVVEEAKAGAHTYLEGLAGPLREKGIDADAHVEVDTQAGHGILRAAEDTGVDLIAMATHARTGVKRTFLGSTADKVVRGAQRPVFLHRP